MAEGSTISDFQEAIHYSMIESEAREALWFMELSSLEEVLQGACRAERHCPSHHIFQWKLRTCRISLWCIYNNCDIRRKKQRERRNPDNMYLNIIQTNCVHNLHLKCFRKIGQGKDSSVKYRSQISCQMINQSTAYRLGTGDCYKNGEGVEKK